MCADNFVAILRPRQVAHLTTGIDLVQTGATERVPEPDATIGGPTPTGQKAVLVWRPRNGLDRRGVVAKLKNGLLWIATVNDVQMIVVATRG